MQFCGFFPLSEDLPVRKSQMSLESLLEELHLSKSLKLEGREIPRTLGRKEEKGPASEMEQRFSPGVGVDQKPRS